MEAGHAAVREAPRQVGRWAGGQVGKWAGGQAPSRWPGGCWEVGGAWAGAPLPGPLEGSWPFCAGTMLEACCLGPGPAVS